jgi:hypothetical protein
VAKDRAAPFSRKHRRYWLPVTGGMILIGVINVAIGLCSYHNPSQPPERIVPVLPRAPLDAAGTIGAADLPIPVLRAFNLRYPQTVAAGARANGDTFTIVFAPGSPHHSATFRGDGTFLSEE